MRSAIFSRTSPRARAERVEFPFVADSLESRVHFAITPLPAGTPPIVRVAYVIPSDRDPQPTGVANLQYAIPTLQGWYRDQMERSGFGPKTFAYETEADGVTPKVHVVEVPDTDDHLRGDIWGRVNAAAGAAGVPLFAQGQVWLLVPEIHTQTPDGDITGGVALGASNGSGRDGGVAQIGTNSLAFLNDASLRDTRSYHGRTVPEIGPYPLVQNVSYASFEGSTISQISSTYLGAMLHELTHAFGLPHDFRNDANFDGNLMGNGFRGFRGAVFPDTFPADAAYLQYGQALMLSTSRYFNRETAPESSGPTLANAVAAIVNGSVRVTFTASDASGLASALLLRNGDQVAEAPLAGTNVNGAISTPYYDAGVAQTFKLMVYDVHGNRRTQDIAYTPPAGFNRAPKPFIDAGAVVAGMGESVSFTSSTTDPDGGTLTYEWDTDGDGTFDTPPSNNSAMMISYPSPGTRLLRLRVTDAQGASAVSAPLSLKVLPLIRGTAVSDALYVRRDPGDPTRIQVFNGDGPWSPISTVALAPDVPLTIDALAGHDRVTLDFAHGSPIPAAGLIFQGGSGVDVLLVRGGSSVDAVVRPDTGGTSGVATIAGGQVNFSDSETIDFYDLASLAYVTPGAADTLSILGQNIPRVSGTSGGATVIGVGFSNVPVVTIDAGTNDGAAGAIDQLTVSADLPGAGVESLRLETGNIGSNDALTLSQGAVVPLHTLGDGALSVSVAASSVLTLTHAQRLRSLSLAGGARAALAFLEGDLRLGGLSLEDGATLDIGDRSVLVATTPENRDAVLAHVVAGVRAAREASPRWSGTGITSSSAVGNPLTGVAAYGRHPDAEEVLIGFTYNGDANADGRINADDYFRIDQGFLAQPANPSYRQGDFNYDGRVNADDYFLIDQAFLGQGAALTPSAAPSSSTSTPATPSVRPSSGRRGDETVRSLTRRRRGVRDSLFNDSRAVLA